jgi:hypothetical protein
VMLCAASIAAQAAPLGDVGEITAAARETSALQKIASRRCWWRNGERHCSRARDGRPRVYGTYQDYPAYGRVRPEDLPTGSTAWWRSMDYERRGGFSGDR